MTRSAAARSLESGVDTAVLVRRATYGMDGAIETSARELGWSAFVARQLEPTTIDDTELELRLASEFPESHLTAKAAMDAFYSPVRTTRAVALLRAVYSKRQLFERVVEFWNDHFSIALDAGECRVLKSIEDRSAIRPHALGRFRDLLEAVSKSAAMLEYLDNRKNLPAAPNENFARELLELHTLGVGEYDERDVREVARCFTGWTIRPREEAHYGEFAFDDAHHDQGAKSVLGHAIPAGGGERDGQIVFDLLARHPATARRIARKLCTRFVAERLPEDLVESVACAFAESGGDIRVTLAELLRPESFEHVRGDETHREPASSKFLRPFHFAVALLRATRATVADADGLLDELAMLGDSPFAWPTPDGPPEARERWESSLLSRWRFVERFVAQEIPGVGFDIDAVTVGSTVDDVIGCIDARVMGGRMSATDRAVLGERARAMSPFDARARRSLLTLAACSPSFQVV